MSWLVIVCSLCSWIKNVVLFDETIRIYLCYKFMFESQHLQVRLQRKPWAYNEYI
jgi:hypothetical protein